MEELNRILDDESINDKQLIKELSTYLKHHAKSNAPINRKFIERIVNIILDYTEISYNGLIFVGGEDIAAWVDYYKIFLFNLTKMKQNNEFKMNKKIYDYYFALFTIVHEITHARQLYILDNKKNDLYSSSNSLIEKNENLYLENHDLVLTERYANLRGHNISYQALSYIYPYEELENLQEISFHYLLYGYIVYMNEELISLKRKTNPYDNSIITSPIDNYNFLLEDIGIEPVKTNIYADLPLYERLYLGLNITPDELNKIDDLYFSTDEKPADMRKLIRKIK